MQTSISLDSVVRAAPSSEVVACRLSNEAALLHLISGTYYSLDEVGAALWELIAAPISVTEIHRTLLQSYDVTSERLENDVLNLLTEMAAVHLIIVEQPTTSI